MIRMLALRSFPFAPNGLATGMVKAGEEFDCPPDIAPGLVQAMICRPADEPPAPHTGASFPGAGTAGQEAMLAAARQEQAEREAAVAKAAQKAQAAELTIAQPADETAKLVEQPKAETAKPAATAAQPAQGRRGRRAAGRSRG